MLLAREKKIVTLLMEHEDKLTTTQIATSLKVSSRTIKTDIKKINEELEKHSCRINSQQGVGLWIEYDNHEAQKYLKEVARDTVDSYLSPEVRKYHLAVELLLKDDYTSMEALAKEYYISKATVLNDLNELDELWEHYGIRFIKKVKYGIKVEGNESQIRSALLEALKRAGGRQKVTISNIQNHFTAVELKDLREIINQMEGRFQFILTDISVGELTMDLAVMLERLSAGKTMDHEGSIPGRESRRMDFVLGHLKEYLTEAFGVEIPDTEDCYLKICLSGLRFHVPMEKEQSLKEKRERNQEMFDFMMELLMECDRKFYLQLAGDDELISALMDHLECMVLRLHSKMYTYNPILDAIKKELFYEYEIASFFMSKFAVKYGFNPTEALFVNGLNADGFFIPTSAKMCAGMTSPLGIAISTVLPWSRNKFTKTEKEQALSLVILSCCYVQEGVIPFQLKDPVRLTASICVGGAITGGLCMMFGLESPAVHGGVFSVAMTSNPLLFIGLWLLGGCITGLLYSILKRPLAEGAEDEEMENPLI